jgi:hypothetical protein
MTIYYLTMTIYYLTMTIYYLTTAILLSPHRNLLSHLNFKMLYIYIGVDVKGKVHTYTEVFNS